MLRNLVLAILFCCYSSVFAAEASTNDYNRYLEAQQVLQKVVAAYGGAERLRNIEKLSFQSDSTYFAYHQSFGVSSDWDPQPQARHYAIDFASNTAAFGRDMAEWSFHDIYYGDEHFRLDNERATFTNRRFEDVNSLAHIVFMSPALITKRMMSSPHHVRLSGARDEKGSERVALAFADPAGRMISADVNVETGLIESLHLVSTVEPFGDVPRFFEYEAYRKIDGVLTPTEVHTGVFDDREFTHRLERVEYNKPIARFIDVPEAYTKVDSTPGSEWRIEGVADGIHLATNGDYNIPLIEFDTFLLAYNASRRFSDVEGALGAAAQAFPDKPVKRVILSHHHFDRAGSVGAYSLHGAVLSAAPQYKKRLRSFVKDRTVTAVNRPTYDAPVFEFRSLADGDEISDGFNQVTIMNVPDNAEAETLFVLYAPKQRILIHEGDLFRKYAKGPLRRKRAGSAALEAFIDNKNLEVDYLIGNRGVIATLKDLRDTNARPLLESIRNGQQD